MDALAYVEQMRASYVQALTQTWRDLVASRASIFPEITVLLSNGLPYTIDFVQRWSDGREYVVEMSTPPAAVPASVSSDYRGLVLHFDAPIWGAMQVTPLDCTLPENRLAAWLTRWMDVDGHFGNAEDAPFSGVVHNMIVDHGKLLIDFGSARAAAFFALMDILKESGCSSARIESSVD